MTHQQGGCLCGAIRYEVTRPPNHVTVCFCRFCQRATGAAGMIEPIFDIGAFAVIKGAPRGTLIPPGFTSYGQHAQTPDNLPLEPVIHQEVHRIG